MRRVEKRRKSGQILTWSRRYGWTVDGTAAHLVPEEALHVAVTTADLEESNIVLADGRDSIDGGIRQGTECIRLSERLLLSFFKSSREHKFGFCITTRFQLYY
jgi:hypothetical protein